MLHRPIIGMAICLDTTGAVHLCKGREYRVIDEFEIDGTNYLNVLCDKGTLYAYPARRFEWKGKRNADS